MELDHDKEASALAEALLDGGLVVDGDTVAFANASAAKLLGASIEELTTRAASPWFPLADDEVLSTWLGERDGECCEEQLRRADGVSFPARVGVSALDAPGGTRFAVSVQDISEQRALAETLEIELAKLEERRTETLRAKQEMIRALSLPVLRVWEGVLAVPLIGALDRQRARETTERLLAEVVSSSARFVIIELTALHAMDSESAAHLARMSSALRLLGSQCLLAGIRPEVARVLVEHDIELGGARCFATQAAALQAALASLGWSFEQVATERVGPRDGGESS